MTYNTGLLTQGDYLPEKNTEAPNICFTCENIIEQWLDSHPSVSKINTALIKVTFNTIIKTENTILHWLYFIPLNYMDQ